MKNLSSLVLGILTVGLIGAALFHQPYVVRVLAGNSGAIWTTNGDCGDITQDINHFDIGNNVFINGSGFDAGLYDWNITGQPGHASSDPGIQVAGGSYTVSATGAFCIDAYTVLPGDDGEYNVSFGNKGDNYRVEAASTPTPTPTPTPEECHGKDCVSPTPAETPVPTATPTPTVAPPGGNPGNPGGPGDGRSDGRSDGLSSCPSCTAPPQGQVLGATTEFAATGVAEDLIMNVVGALGGISTAGGLCLMLAAKKKLNI